MLPPVGVEQQAKLGVSAEESKEQRLKRQQARFRDRGGVFVPSTSNPLVDILLARTVSGESPSKARPKDVVAKRLSPSKARQTAVAGASRVVAGGSKSKPPAKRKVKAVESKADTVIKAPPKRRGRPAKGEKKALGSDAEHPPPDINSKTKSTSKGKGKQRDVAPSTSDGNSKTKTKPQTKAKSKPIEVAEALVSDDDRTLVDVPHKVKAKRHTRYQDGDESDDVPIVRKRIIPHVDNSKASDPSTATRIKTEKVPSIANPGKKSGTDTEERLQRDKGPKTDGKKRLVLPDDDDDVVAPPLKKGKAGNTTSTNPIEPQRVLCTTKDVKTERNPEAADKGRGKGRVELHHDSVESVKEDGERRPAERASKPKKRKKEADNQDDRPRKVVKFSDPSPSHPSSQRLKENQNQSEKKHKSAAKLSVKEESRVPRPELATNAFSRAKTPKGPPREVLERIKASAVQYLRCADNEPDELDCLS